MISITETGYAKNDAVLKWLYNFITYIQNESLSL